MWRVVLGYSVALLNHVGEDGVWRPPGDRDIEVLVTPPIRTVADPRRYSLRAAMDIAGWDDADCYLHCLPEYYPLPIDAFTATPRVAVAICDWNVAGRVSHLLRSHVDAIVCDHPGAEVLAAPDGPPVVPGLLWGWDAAAWEPARAEGFRDIDVLFVGSRNQAIHPRRERWLARLGRMGGRHRVQIHSSVYGDDYRRLHERAKLVFNHSVRGEANMRSFEAAVAGACVLNERDNDTLRKVFAPDVDYATYGAGDLETVVDELLADDRRRLAIARSGQRAALGHSYDVHWAGILRDLRRTLDAEPRERDLDGAAAVVAEQWRTSTMEEARDAAGWAARAGGVDARDADRVEALATLGGPRGLMNGDWAVADRALRGLARGDEAVGDAAVLLGRAETAAALGRADEAVAHAEDVLTGDVQRTDGLAPTRFDPWQVALEALLVRATGPDEHRAVATRWAHARARCLKAAVLAPGDEPDLSGFEEVVPGLVTRAEARLVRGEIDGAIVDLRAASEQWPLDPGLIRRLADVLAAAGDRAGARAVLVGLADSLEGFPADRELCAQLRTEAEAAADVEDTLDRAWCWAPDLDDAALRTLVHLRAIGAVAAERLVIACPDEPTLERVAAVATEALRARGIDAEALPDTEIELDAHDDEERWRRVASARMVVARPDSAVEGLARRMGRAVLMPCE